MAPPVLKQEDPASRLKTPANAQLAESNSVVHGKESEQLVLLTREGWMPSAANLYL